MIKFAPYILKTLWRHRARTLLTVSGSAVAMFVFCIVGAVREGMHDLQRRQEAEQSLVMFQANKFCPATSHLPQDYENRVRRLPGVREVVPIQVFTNNCRASLDIVVFYGVPPEKLRPARDFQLLSGDWSAFEKHQDGALVGRSVAGRRRLKVGDRFSIGGYTVSVDGIFASDNRAEENYIYTHLDFLQRGKGWNRVGTVTQFEVLLAPGVDAAAASRQIDNALRGGPVETDTRPKGVFQAKALGDLQQLIELANYVGFACIGLVLALVATTTVMSVEDRVAEHAVLQTLGFSGGRVAGLILSESMWTSLIGGVIGVSAAMVVLAFSGLAVGAEAVSVAFTPSWRLAATGLLISLLAGLLAALAPAVHAARAEIVPALRR